MRLLFVLLSLVSCATLLAQTQQTPEQIRAEMAKIRQTTNWDDPAEAKKANDEIRKLANLLAGNSLFSVPSQNQQQNSGNDAENNLRNRIPPTRENMLAIAARFYNRSYKALDAISKMQFDRDYKMAETEKFSLEAVRRLSTTGGFFLTFGNDHFTAGVYLASAAKALPADTLCVNNFAAYLRDIDSVKISIPVLLYAMELYSESPIILTQLGNSYFELNDYKNAEKYYRDALKINPDFGQAHASLCELYIKQNRLQDAIAELLAGVKGFGFSYSQGAANFAFLQSKTENSSGNESEKEKIWDETKNRLNPPDALASLVPAVERLKMPAFGDCPNIADWMEGGGYSLAVKGYNQFLAQLTEFSKEFQDINKELPSLPANTVLLDYPNERLALDILTELYRKESNLISKDYQKSIDEIMQRVNDANELYLKNFEQYSKEYASCLEGCSDDYCFRECFRQYCLKDCPNANKYNERLQDEYNNYRSSFSAMVSDQIKLMDDFYGFSEPWLSKIFSPYWSKIYAFEIQNVALSIIGNCYGAYPCPFPIPPKSACGTDCSIYAKPFPKPPEEVDVKKPNGNECNMGKIDLGLGPCGIGLDCESIEFGCAEGVAFSVKRNFKKKTTTGFIGAGFKGNAGFISAGIQAGMQITVTDNNEIADVGFKSEASAGAGFGPANAGISESGSLTLMTGLKGNVGFSIGGSAN